MANFRALQPAPLDDEALPQQPQTRPVLTQKPKRTVTLGACVACRKRKSKCDGSRPVCTCCSQKDTECVYELGPNEKPSQAMKRKNEEMQGELSNLRQLYDFLRLRPEQEAMEIFRRIRSNSADTSPSSRIRELADFVRHGDPPSRQSPYPPPSPYQPDMAKSVTLPPIRIALDSPSSNLDSHSLPYPGMMHMHLEGPPTQRRRYDTDIDVSARSDSQGTHPRPTSIDAILHPTSSVESHDVVDETPMDSRLASARNWTNVTTDTNLLVSILSTWTTREFCYYHYLDRDAFLDDMASGRSHFCSKLLVNAVLATACSTSPAVKDRAKPFSDKSIATAFYAEAARLWDVEAGTSSLTRIQAAICLYLFLGKVGRDKSGHVFLTEACRMSEELGLFSEHSSYAEHNSPSVPERKWDVVRAVTAWALFNFQLNMSFTYSFPVIIQSVPAVAMPYQHKPDVEALFRSECAKHIIILDCVAAIRSYIAAEDHARHPELIEACYARLTSWWHTRPASLDPNQEDSKVNILCAMMYHVNIINLFQPVLDHGISCHNHDSYLARARSVTSTSLLELRRLLTLHERRHCWGTAILIVLHPITVASLGSLDEIAQKYPDPRGAERSECYQGVLVCLRALCALSSFSYYAQPLLRQLTQKCQLMGLQLPDDVQSALDHYTSEEWTRNAANLVSSQYIVDTRKTTVDGEGARMDSIISAWGGLSLDERGKGKDRLG
ncbi:hypothetical protein HBH56_118810 [Parastagonospora nodorum]|uniref:Zn(2)-C6 fungal-type domain-containing protein n=1 Tax=Phaeosphaeria nodorum (strain SN15 / ATCC MYA-4574 / FGSC 10173) TaxID=321614 RepID=A0A7U2I8R2_PHANO|nr:hypothetical protein HBH56_118810 [Parastagonospora nodorum]QRD05322.1 hypothetical protein JI435_112170 [Parastagonospora nodorum SN15]KAH3928814.1 hypothetical protein HBH54_130390 [Parastagonospora nodorum]KAH3959889.1 hypothetical protein HBH51_197210 [Parastagonospora nodorum]KAH3998678.1 hypothetical protein HBI10_128100 [Parastagonospora nodorum]